MGGLNFSFSPSVGMKEHKMNQRLNKAYGKPVGILFLISAVLFVAFVLHTRTSDTASENLPRQFEDTSPSTDPAAAKGLIWKTQSKEDSEITLRYAADWHKLDTTKLRNFDGECFAPKPGNSLIGPQFCIDLDPWVRRSVGMGFASNNSSAQEEFFAEISSLEAGETVEVGTRVYEVLRHYKLRGFPAVEMVETHSPDAEGIEPSYIVSTYINHPELGLLRLSESAETVVMYSQYSSKFHEIRGSFVVTP